MCRYALVTVLSCLILVSPCLSRYEERRRSRTDHSEPGELNICDLQAEQQINMFCYCDNTEKLGNATDANCWLFNTGEPENSSVWSAFKYQKGLTRLTFHIRAVSSLPYVPTRAFKHLPKLKAIEIVYGKIETVEPFAFANLTLLQDLALIRNRIVNLKKFSISFLPDLKVITLGENRIGELNREVFVSLPSLRKLYMDRNNLSLIHEGAFASLYSLEELELHGNQLTVVTRDTFRGLTRLRRLDLSANLLTYIAEGTFSEMPALEELLLERNAIEALDPGALIDLQFLGKVYLSSNNLRTLPPGLFEDTTSLRFLNVRNNTLHTLNFQVFAPIMQNLMNQTAYLLIDDSVSHKMSQNISLPSCSWWQFPEETVSAGEICNLDFSDFTNKALMMENNPSLKEEAHCTTANELIDNFISTNTFTELFNSKLYKFPVAQPEDHVSELSNNVENENNNNNKRKTIHYDDQEKKTKKKSKIPKKEKKEKKIRKNLEIKMKDPKHEIKKNNETNKGDKLNKNRGGGGEGEKEDEEEYKKITKGIDTTNWGDNEDWVNEKVDLPRKKSVQPAQITKADHKKIKKSRAEAYIRLLKTTLRKQKQCTPHNCNCSKIVQWLRETLENF